MKAVIVEIKDSVAAILSEDGTVSKIRNKNYVVGQQIIIRNNNKYIKFAASAAAALVLFVTPAWAYLTPYSYVSLDINPSFEFSINRFDRVLEVRAVNDDGKNVVENISIAQLKNKEIKEAVKNVLVELKDQGYLIEGKEGGVVVATSSKSQQKTDELSASLKTAVEKEIEFVAKKDDKIKNNENNENNEDNENNKEKSEIKTEEVKEEKEIEKADEAAEINKEAKKEDKKGDSKPEEVKEVKEVKESKELKESKNEEKEHIKEAKETRKSSEDASKKEKEDAKFEKKFNVEVIEVSQDEVDEAKKHNVTPGKLNLVKKLEEVYPKTLDFNADEWFEKPVKEIMDSINEYSKSNKEQNKEQNKESNKEPNKKLDKEDKQNKSNK